MSDTYKIEWGGTNARIDGSNSSDYLRFFTSNTERIRINSDGNVAVGQTSPYAPTGGGSTRLKSKNIYPVCGKPMLYYVIKACKESKYDIDVLVSTDCENIERVARELNVNIHNRSKKNSINTAVASLRDGLSNNVIQYTDTLGNVVTTTSGATRRALERQLDQAIERQTVINSRVDDLNQQLFEYETKIVEVQTNSEVGSELGPLKYLAGLTGLSMDKIINYLLLTIIFVFDPLAISLVIAANFAFVELRPSVKEEIKVIEKIIEVEKPLEVYGEKSSQKKNRRFKMNQQT